MNAKLKRKKYLQIFADGYINISEYSIHQTTREINRALSPATTTPQAMKNQTMPLCYPTVSILNMQLRRNKLLRPQRRTYISFLACNRKQYYINDISRISTFHTCGKLVLRVTYELREEFEIKLLPIPLKKKFKYQLRNSMPYSSTRTGKENVSVRIRKYSNQTLPNKWN